MFYIHLAPDDREPGGFQFGIRDPGGFEFVALDLNLNLFEIKS